LSDSDESEVEERAETNPRAPDNTRHLESSDSETDEEMSRQAAGRRHLAGAKKGMAGRDAAGQSESAAAVDRKEIPEVVKRVEKAIRNHIASQRQQPSPNRDAEMGWNVRMRTAEEAAKVLKRNESHTAVADAHADKDIEVGGDRVRQGAGNRDGAEAGEGRGRGERSRSERVLFEEDALKQAVAETDYAVYENSGGEAAEEREEAGQKNTSMSGPIMRHAYSDAGMCQTLDEALLLYVMVASCLGLMILAEFLGSSYLVGALLGGLVFGGSEYAASVWSARTRNVISWVDTCAFACGRICIDDCVVHMFVQVSVPCA